MPARLPAAERPVGRPIALGLAATALALAVAAAVAWRLAGGSAFVVATPSMCPARCVGSLVLERPLTTPARPGMVVSFRPPGIAAVYTHRVVAVLADGRLRTAGEVLGRADPWTVPRQRVLGRVVATIAGLGWLWRCLPAMAAALALYLLARSALQRRLRPHADRLFVVVLVAVPVAVLDPFVQAEVVAVRLLPRGAALRVLNTGLLAARLRLGSARPATVAPGHLIELTTHAPRAWLSGGPTAPAVAAGVGGCALAAVALLFGATRDPWRPTVASDGPPVPAADRPLMSGVACQDGTWRRCPSPRAEQRSRAAGRGLSAPSAKPGWRRRTGSAPRARG